MGVSKTCDHTHIKIKMSNPNKESPGPTKALDQDLKDMDVLCTFKIKIESHSLKKGSIKDQWPYPNQDQMLNPSKEPLATNQDLKDMDVLFTFMT